jgi:hypothetical protein
MASLKHTVSTLALAGVLLLPVASWSTTKDTYISRETIDERGGVVKVLMPCNWLKNKAVTLVGLYSTEQDERGLPHSEFNAVGEIGILRVSARDQVDLKGVLVRYTVNPNRRCKESLGLDNLVR